MPQSPHLGFTLAELLVSLLILAEIATFTIPKVLSAQQNAQKMAIFKEDIATIEQGVYMATLTGLIQTKTHSCTTSTPIIDSEMATIIKTFLNYTTYDSVHHTFTLHNGSTIEHVNSVVFSFKVDWNGASGNNTLGDDQVEFFYSDCNVPWTIGGALLSPERFGPNVSTAPNFTLWKTIFQ